MEEIVATIFLRRLNSLLREESEIFGGLEDEILLLKAQLSHLTSHIQPFYNVLVQIGYFSAMSNIISIELKESIHNWLVRFKETIHDADNCIELFIIRMNNNSKDGLNDSDRIVAAALLGCELRIINECLVEILDVKSQLDTSIAPLSIEHNAIIDDEGENSFINKFITLPIDLKSCFMYSCLYIGGWRAIKDELVKLLMAVGLIEEIPGERMEDIVQGNINKLIELGMFQVQNAYLHESLHETLHCSIPKPYYHYVAAGDGYSYIKDFRHLFIHNKEIAVKLENIHISSIRSSFISNPLKMKLYDWKLLRVLRLSGSKSIIIEEVGNLINLRYLKLTFHKLEKLPESIGNLRNLQTLDIDCPELKEIPSGILNLLQLRHLKLLSGVKEPIFSLIGIGRLTNLQTLSGLYVGDGIASELSNLTQIRELGIVELGEEDASELYASIMKMTGLLSLSLSATTTGEIYLTSEEKFYYIKEELLPSLEPFSPPPLLQKLRLAGCLQEMPDWFSSMKNLTHLALAYSNLLENPTSVLESLPNLKFLELLHAYPERYIGREFCRSGGFPTLETLIIISYSLIEWMELEQGSFPSLKFLCFRCPNLRTLPEGLQLITTLQKLNMVHCHGDLARKLSPDGGPENYKIKHIPRIEFHW